MFHYIKCSLLYLTLKRGAKTILYIFTSFQKHFSKNYMNSSIPCWTITYFSFITHFPSLKYHYRKMLERHKFTFYFQLLDWKLVSNTIYFLQVMFTSRKLLIYTNNCMIKLKSCVTQNKYSYLFMSTWPTTKIFLSQPSID